MHMGGYRYVEGEFIDGIHLKGLCVCVSSGVGR
jgi:hypothetical protein